MTDVKKKPSVVFPLILIGLVVIILGGYAAYVAVHKDDFRESEKGSTQTIATPVQGTDSAAPASTPAPQTMAAASTVVDTKTLSLPSAPAPQIPVATSTDSKVEEMMAVRKVGSDVAPIKIVEYASLTCGHCSAFHQNDYPRIKSEYIDTGKVQMIFKEFPLNKPAIDASMLLRCLPAERYESFMGLLFSEQPKWAYQTDYLAPLKQYAKLAGLSDTEIESCLTNVELEKRIIGDMKLSGEKYNIQSTPSFVINDGTKTLVGHQPYGFIKQTLDEILDTAGKVSTQNTPVSASAPVPELPIPTTEAKQ